METMLSKTICGSGWCVWVLSQEATRIQSVVEVSSLTAGAEAFTTTTTTSTSTSTSTTTHHQQQQQQQHRTLALYILQLWNHRGNCWRDSQCWDTPNGSKWLDLGSKVKVSPNQRLQAMCSSSFWNTLNTSSRVFQQFFDFTPLWRNLSLTQVPPAAVKSHGNSNGNIGTIEKPVAPATEKAWASLHWWSCIHTVYILGPFCTMLSRVCLTTAQVANFLISSACLWTMHPRLECLGLNEPDRRPKILMLDARIPPVVVSVCLVLSLRKVEGRGSQCVSSSAGTSGMRYSTCTLAIC